VGIPSLKRPLQQANNNFRQPATATHTNGATPRPVESPSADPARPKRAGKKRRYDERSFEGYGEGYVDDDVDMAAGGYSTGDGEDGRRSGKKRRKKVGSREQTLLAPRQRISDCSDTAVHSRLWMNMVEAMPPRD
jgi:hypothetical protein